MAEEQKSEQQKIPAAPPQKPAAASFDVPRGAAEPKKTEPIIRTMPKEYIGVMPKVSVKKKEEKKPASEAVPAPAPVRPAPAVGAKAVPAVSAKKPVKKRRTALIIAGIGVLFIAVLGIGGFLLLRSVKQQTPAPPVQVTVPAPAPAPAPPPTPPRPPAPPPEPEPIRPGIDSDSDGLTDIEERAIYGSGARNSDTDRDSFIDGNEVLHLYDPTRPSPARLEENGTLRLYQNTVSGYAILVPKTWRPSQESPAVSTDPLIFEVPTGESIIIRAETGRAALVEFAETEFPDADFGAFTTKQGLRGLRSEDGRTAVLELEDGFIAAEYSLGDKRTIEFLRTFEMMLGSLIPAS